MKFEIYHAPFCTVVDGKAINAVMRNLSQQTCYICGATPVKMNNYTSRVRNLDSLKFGLSPRHAWIRVFEAILHISYRLEIKKWKVIKRSDKKSSCTTKFQK